MVVSVGKLGACSTVGAEVVIESANPLDQLATFYERASNCAISLRLLIGTTGRVVRRHRLLVLTQPHCELQAQIEHMHRAVGFERILEKIG